jgi:predicted O-linked N-acetylglucosamine transferase (SPINDLY family)
MAPSLEDTFKLALAALQAGKLDEAERLFKKVLQREPKNFGALNLLAIALMQGQRHAAAEPYLKTALTVNAQNDATFNNYGMVLKALKRPQEALARFSQALALNGANGLAWNNRGTVLNDLGRYEEAVADFDKATTLDGKFADAFANKGNSLGRLKRYDEALAAYERALTLAPGLSDAWLGRGNVLRDMKRNDDAIAAYDRLLALDPGSAAAWIGRGNALFDRGDHDGAVAAYDRALAIQPGAAEAWTGRGNVAFERKRHDEALAAFDKALAMQPDAADAWLGRGNAQFERRDYGKALAAYQRALNSRGDLPAALLGLGNVFVELNRLEEAIAAYDRALSVDANLAEVWLGRGNACLRLSRFDDAVAGYDKALALKPRLHFAAGSRYFAKMNICDWRKFGADSSTLLAALRQGEDESYPFISIALPCTAADQLKFAEKFSSERHPASAHPRWRGEIYSHPRIRIAYLSSDLHDHAVAYLLTGVFECHDRSRFETFGVSLGPPVVSKMRERIEKSFDRFLDVSGKRDTEVADILRELEIDIAINLNGFTRGERTDIFAMRPAPVQVAYIGYPGTMGASYIDYIIADNVLIPPGHDRYYTEKVVRMPDTYQANDSQRRISERMPTRAENGLPETGFVFCSFNNTFKITPDVFDIWMRLLKQTENSCLWLFKSTAGAADNLVREASARGISADRLVMAPRMTLEDHLARQQLADLFLDTLPCNAVTTASDALWAGLPVVTCLGSTFSGRIAASLLTAIGMPELITERLEDYERLALKLAHDPPLLTAIKAKLARQRNTSALFDTERFTRNLESAYATMHERLRRGQLPAALTVLRQ